MKGFNEALTVEYIPRVLPIGWVAANSNTWMNRSIGLVVILSGEVHNDSRWLHLSVSRQSRVPSYDDLCLVKRVFIGDRKAIQVFPPKAEHVNIHNYCLHLWACLDADSLPDFRVNGGL